MLQRVVVCCSLSCSVLHFVAECGPVRYSEIQRDAECCSVLQCVAVCCSVLQCVAVCYSVYCSVLKCVAVCCCSVLQ